MFKIGNKINPNWEIDIPNKTITSGCRFWRFETLEELLVALNTLIKEINDCKGEQ